MADYSKTVTPRYIREFVDVVVKNQFELVEPMPTKDYFSHINGIWTKDEAFVLERLHRAVTESIDKWRADPLNMPVQLMGGGIPTFSLCNSL